MVVIIHFGRWDSPSGLDKILLGIFNAEARFAVPVFFMITGYFYPSIIKRGRFKGHLQKIISMTLFATLLYFCFNLLFYNLNGGISGEYLAKIFSLRHFLEWLLINSVPIEGHLWYFYAVIYALLILYMADKLHLRRQLYVFSFIALQVCVCVNFTPYSGYCRNFLFMGLPFICLGRIMAESKHASLLLNLSNHYLWGVLLISILLV
jgi:surface polysaccharide O-acyltransferase-like enzyme